MENQQKPRLAIIGLGPFTRLMIEHLADGFDVAVYSRSPDGKPKDGLQFEFIDLDQLRREKIIILSVPSQFIELTLEKFAGDLAPGTLVIDVASVKVRPVEAMQRLLPAHVDILGTHPIFGPGSAKDGLQGLQIVLCPVRIAENKLNTVKDHLQSIGLIVLEMTPDQHDREMAYVLGLTQALGRTMKNMEIPNLTLSTPAYDALLKMRDIQGTDSWDLFESIHNENQHARPVLDQTIDEINQLRNKLDRR